MAERESNTVIGITQDGKEQVMPALATGPGHRSKPPPPHSEDWKLIVEAGIASGLAAEPPALYEVKLWEQIRDQGIDLAYVRSSESTGSPQLIKGWQDHCHPAPTVQKEDPPAQALGEQYRDRTPVLRLPVGAEVDLVERVVAAVEANLPEELYLGPVDEPVIDGDFHLYSPEGWQAVLEDLVVRLVEVLEQRPQRLPAALLKRLALDKEGKSS